jgi:four helix bundle protein
MAYSSFENLEVWRRAVELAVCVCRQADSIASMALRNQIHRCVISVPSNIAEGSERDSVGDYVRFLRIAKGSAAELRTQLLIARRLGYLESNFAGTAEDEARQIGAMLQGLIRSLNASELRDTPDNTTPYGSASPEPLNLHDLQT